MFETTRPQPTESEQSQMVAALQSGDYEAYIDLAKDFCQAMEVEHLWHGVEYDTSREAQIKESKRKLAGFYPDLKKLDELRWNRFWDSVQLLKIYTVGTFSKLINESIFSPHVRGSQWDAEASNELTYFFDYLEQFVLNNEITSQQIVELVSSRRCSIVAAEFLTMHVGTGEHKVANGKVTGLDGEEETCPIAHANFKGIKYFAVTAAEYFLMSAVGKRMIENP